MKKAAYSQPMRIFHNLAKLAQEQFGQVRGDWLNVIEIG